MREALQNLLYARYPHLYRQKNLPMSQTCMCWGFSCDDGWFVIIDSLSKQSSRSIRPSRRSR